MPPSRAHVLWLLSQFQSSIAVGEPPLEQLLTRSASLTAPGADGRRSSPNRSAVVGALGANFVDPELSYDPLDVSVREDETGTVASVPLTSTGGSARRIVLDLGLGYDRGMLRIRDIALSRAP